MSNINNTTNRGRKFEERVYHSIKKLEKIGFAQNIILQEQVKDCSGNVRKIDISFILCSFAVKIQVSIECKSRDKILTLNEIDQIKVFKNELPKRNIFWLVSENDAGEKVKNALRTEGISFYTISELEQIIEGICSDYWKYDVYKLRYNTHYLSKMNKHRCHLLSSALKLVELAVLLSLYSTCGVLHAFNNDGTYKLD